MERIAIRYQDLINATKTLEEPLEYLKKTSDPLLYKIIRDSAIQRLEYTYEALWQFLKQYLLEIHNIETDSPRNIFIEMNRIGIITKDETTHLLQIARDRNQTSHAYHEQIAERISKHIPKHLMLIKSLIKRLENKL